MNYKLPRRSVREFFGFGWPGMLALSLIVLATAFLLCRYVANFTNSQAATLAIFAMLYADFAGIRPQVRQFEPFNIRFEPKFVRMLCVLGLVRDESDWNQRLEQRPDLTAHGQPSPEKFGFSCTTLTLESEHAHSINLWRPWQLYTTNYKIEFNLEALAYDPSQVWDAPTFFIEHVTPEGAAEPLFNAFGIKVNKHWWKERLVPADLHNNIVAVIESWNEILFVFGVVPVYAMTSWSRDPYLFDRPRHRMKRDIENTINIARSGWSQVDSELSSYFDHVYMSIYGANSGFLKTLPGLDSVKPKRPTRTSSV